MADGGVESTALDSDRSAEIRRYIEWAVRRPGAEEPRRPDVTGGDTPTAR